MIPAKKSFHVLSSETGRQVEVISKKEAEQQRGLQSCLEASKLYAIYAIAGPDPGFWSGWGAQRSFDPRGGVT